MFNISMELGTRISTIIKSDNDFETLGGCESILNAMSEIYQHLVNTKRIVPLEEMPQQDKTEFWEFAKLNTKNPEFRVKYCKTLAALHYFISLNKAPNIEILGL